MRQLKISQQITNRESASVDKYLQEISKVEMITPDEEVELARRIKEGDRLALEKLTKANLRFVVSVAKQYQNQGLQLADLINEGNLGLIKAAERFDETKGFKFISYAVWWIRQSILQSITEHSKVVRVPLNRTGDARKTMKVFAQLEQKFNREPSPEEVAEIMECTPKEVMDNLKVTRRHISMDAPLIEGEDNTLLNVMENDDDEIDTDVINSSSLKIELRRALSKLSEIQKKVLIMYFGLDGSDNRTLDEIGEQVGLTRERVRQIKEQAIRKLKKSQLKDTLRTYLS